ncbi:MAG: glycosyltransferase family 2 protein [Candidatus Micrarchaeia archaeon]
MKKPRKITFILCALNEEKAIGKVIDRIPRDLARKTEIIVVDNASTDRTGEIARSKGAKVIVERKRGKGNALLTGFRNVSKDSEYVLMIDADNTYSPEEAGRLLELLQSGFADVVIGSRLSGRIEGGALSYLNRVGNWVITFLVRVLYRGTITDVTTGFVAWKRPVIDKLALYCNSGGFGIETEMLTKICRLGYSVYSVPITYQNRIGSSRLRPFSDGAKIITIIGKNLFWTPDK